MKDFLKSPYSIYLVLPLQLCTFDKTIFKKNVFVSYLRMRNVLNYRISLLSAPQGLMRGYAAEKQSAEEHVRVLEQTELSLAHRLELAQSRLSELDEHRAELQLREGELERLKQALEGSVGESQQGGSKMD